MNIILEILLSLLGLVIILFWEVFAIIGNGIAFALGCFILWIFTGFRGKYKDFAENTSDKISYLGFAVMLIFIIPFLLWLGSKGFGNYFIRY